MEEFEFIEIGNKEIFLTVDDKKYAIKKPSALKLVDIHEAGKTIDTENDIRGLVVFQIKTLIDLGLQKDVAESLDLATLMACFTALSKAPVKKK